MQTKQIFTKHILFMTFLCIFFLIAACSSEEETEQEEKDQEQNQGQDKSVTQGKTSGQQQNNLCGDGVCDSAEQSAGQNDAAFCPIDCSGESKTTEKTTKTTATSSQTSASSSSTQSTSSTPLQTTTEDTSSYPSVPEEFTFIVDDGIRMLDASNPGAKLNDDGTISLLYEYHLTNSAGTTYTKQMIATSEDGLTFEDNGEEVTREEAGAFRAKQLPDGTWIGYGYDTTKGIEGNCLTSQSSDDGETYTEDDGCRYELQEDDNGSMGVYDFFADSEDNIVLLYIGDLMGLNNVRRAYSTDGGETFTFTNDNVLGDEDLGGGARSYVDEKVLALDDSDDRVFLIAMQMGIIYGFISEDDGVSFQRYKEALLSPGDFIDSDYGQGSSLHDPQIIQLEDGRYRIYVTVSFNGNTENIDDDTETIVSATTG